MGVWYQAKNAPKSQVALKALYTIYHSLTEDFYYGALQQYGIGMNENNAFFRKVRYFDNDETDKWIDAMSNDPDYGLNK